MQDVNHGQRAHALLSCSGSSRWLKCQQSARLEESFPNTTSAYAAEGTLAHEFADLGLQRATRKITLATYRKELRVLKAHMLYSKEMDGYVDEYISYVMQQYKAAKRKNGSALLLIEQKLDLTQYIPEGFGSNDAVIITDGEIEIVDLKYGMGVKVFAKDNSQLLLYGLGALTQNDILYDIKTVKTTIVQPRLSHIDNDTVSVKALIQWVEDTVKPKAKLAFEGAGDIVAGEHCRWCKVAPRCKTLANKNLAIAKEDFADTRLLEDDSLMEVYGELAQISTWIKNVMGYVFEQAIAGKQWPGYKLVRGRSNRKWIDETQARKALLSNFDYGLEDISQTELLGITAIEKLVGKKEFAEELSDVVEKPLGKPVLVAASDKRAEYVVSTAAEDFKD